MSNSSFNAAQSRAALCISQNFLTSRKTIERLMRLTSIGPDDTVVEIGAGKGHITRALKRRCGAVLAWELDGALSARLIDEFRGDASVRVFAADFLKARLPGQSYKVFANIPFSITTAIVKKLTQGSHPPEEMWLAMEKGAAKRLTGSSGENAHSLAIKPFFDARVVYHFARSDFHPAPRVDVVMLHLKKKQNPDIAPDRREAFVAFVERAMKGGLTGRGGALTPAQISRSLRAEGLEQLPRSGEVLYIQWLCLFRCAERFGRK